MIFPGNPLVATQYSLMEVGSVSGENKKQLMHKNTEWRINLENLN